MRITGVQASSLSSPSGDAQPRHGDDSKPLHVLELTTDGPLLGLAISRVDVFAHADALVRELLVGEDPRAVTELWHKLSYAPVTGAAHTAAALLDIAMWDLKSKANAEPLWRTLGGSRPHVNVHASACTISDSDESLRNYHAGLVREYGFRAAKLQVGVDLNADLRRLGLLQQLLRVDDAEPSLIIDAEERWSAKDAIRCTREIERRFELDWVEAPTRRHDFLGLQRVSNAIRSAVCGGAGLDGLAQFLPHWHARGLDIIQLDTARVGITGAMQLADAAFGLELPVVLCDSPGNLNAQLAGALPNVVSLEVSNAAPVVGALTSDVRIAQGRAGVGDAPGHGVRVIHAPEA